MGRMSLFGTDLFLCLFGVFAMLRAIVPTHLYTQPVYPFIQVTWPSEFAQHCFFSGTLNGENLLSKNQPFQVTWVSDERLCVFRSSVESSSIAPPIALELFIPVLADCSSLEVKLGGQPSQVSDPDCSAVSATLRLSSEDT